MGTAQISLLLSLLTKKEITKSKNRVNQSIPTHLLVPRAHKGPHVLAPPIDAVLVPETAARQLYEGGADEEAEAGEGAGDAVAVAGGPLFVGEGVDAVVRVVGGEGAAEAHGWLMYSGMSMCVFAMAMVVVVVVVGIWLFTVA